MFFLSSSVDFRDFFYVSRELCKNTAKTVIVLLLLQNRKRFIVVPLFYYTLLFYKMEYCSLPLPFVFYSVVPVTWIFLLYLLSRNNWVERTVILRKKKKVGNYHTFEWRHFVHIFRENLNHKLVLQQPCLILRAKVLNKAAVEAISCLH